MTAICVRRRILQYAPTSSKDDDQKEINPVGTLAGNATFAPPLKTPGDRKMRRKNWMTSRAENVGSSLEEEKTVNGREGEAEAAEAAEAEEAGGGGERKPVAASRLDRRRGRLHARCFPRRKERKEARKEKLEAPRATGGSTGSLPRATQSQGELRMT